MPKGEFESTLNLDFSLTLVLPIHQFIVIVSSIDINIIITITIQQFTGRDKQA